MFETALIRRHSEGPQIVDAGILAETLLFYDHVHVLADRGLLSDLLRVIGVDGIKKMLEMKAVSLSYMREMTGVMTNTANGVATNKFSIFEIIMDKNTKKIRDADDLELVVESVFRAGAGRA
jgi:hypothetical protein